MPRLLRLGSVSKAFLAHDLPDDLPAVARTFGRGATREGSPAMVVGGDHARLGAGKVQGSMTISIVICTYNRSAGLRRTLDSILASALSGIDWELIIVDNNSADDPRAVAEDFLRRSGVKGRYVFEPRQGLSHARNAG